MDMELSFVGAGEELAAGIARMQKRLGYTVSASGAKVAVAKREKGLRVYKSGADMGIEYAEKADFFRALGLLAEKCKGGDFDITQESCFKTLGAMLDVSRNAVLTVAGVKKQLEVMAIMGFNMLMLYTEDTYEVEGRPYFGYMRGRYSEAEIREMDDVAYELGIEMIPCIQTLGHLQSVLKWSDLVGAPQDCAELSRWGTERVGAPKDQSSVLLVDDERTYQFIEEMITAATKPYRSKKIHLGMDEAGGLGLGAYYDIHGYVPSFELMCRHLSRVKAIAEKHGLEPIIWSDMFFKAVSKTHDYFDTEIEFTKEDIEAIPKGVTLAYFDYQHEEQEHYEKMLALHQQLGNPVLFAGGVLTWIGIAVNYDITFVCARAALEACRKQGADQVMATLWGDDGAETNMYSALLGLQLYSEYAYQPGEVTDELLSERFLACTGERMDDFVAISDLDCIETYEGEIITDTSNPSKYLLYQDILLGLFDRHVEDYPIAEYYEGVYRRLKTAQERAGEFRFVFDVPVALAKLLTKKSDIGVRITRSYRAGDREALRGYVEKDLPEIRALVEELCLAHREQWFKYYKPFGWEIQETRYGGVAFRVDTAIYRLKQYLGGEIDSIPELEEERLAFDGEPRPKCAGFGRGISYKRIISGGCV